MERIDAHPATVVDLIRHGMPVGGPRYRGHRDDPLSEKGWAQMWAAVGDACPWDVIVTSPLTRCAAFARALAKRYSRPVEVEPGFKEIGFGVWEGQHVNDILRDTPRQMEDYWRDPLAHTPPGGESLDAFQTRVSAAWDAMIRRYYGRKLLIVSHDGVIRSTLVYLLKMPPRAVLQIEVPNACLTRIRVQPNVNGAPSPSLEFHGRRTL